MITILQNSNLLSYFNFSEVGDTLILSQDFFLGINSVISFEEESDFDDINSGFSRYCSYTVDGVNWSNWEEMTNEMLSKINVKNNFPFSIKFKYIRTGNGNGNAKLYSISLDIDYLPLSVPTFYSQTFYSKFFPFINIGSISWSTNLIEKIFKKGFVPDFIKRGENINWEDENYLNFWFPIIYFLSFPYVWDLYLKDFHLNKNLLRKYLEQRGLVLSKDSDLLELNFILKFQYEEIFKRGSRDIFNKNTIFGEFLRLINQSDQLLSTMGIISGSESGLIVGGNYLTYEKNLYPDFLIPFDFNLINPVYIISGNFTEEGKTYKSYKINTNNLEVFSGLESESKFISPDCNYLISFKVKGSGKLNFGVIVKNSNEEIVDCFNSEIENNIENNFLTDYEFNSLNGLFVEGVLLNNESPVQEPASKYLNLNYLRLNEDAYKVSFSISVASESEIILYDISAQLIPTNYNHSYLLPVSELLIKLDQGSLLKPVEDIKKEAEWKLFPLGLYWGDYEPLLPNIIVPSDTPIGEGFPYILPVSLGVVSNPPAPTFITVETEDVTAITDFTAVSGGLVTSTDVIDIISVGVCWSTFPNPTILDNFTEDGSSIGSFESELTLLTPETTYYVRAYVKYNVNLIEYGNQKTFVTESSTLLSGSTDYTHSEAGDIVLSDRSFVSLSDYNEGGYLPAIGVVGRVYGDNITVIALSKSNGIQWDPSSSPLDLPLTNCPDSNTGLDDLDGFSNTSVILNALGTSPLFAAGYCYNYSTQGTNSGDWYLPSMGELFAILLNYIEINISLSSVGNFTIKDNTSSDFEDNLAEVFWTSTEYNNESAWILYVSGGGVYDASIIKNATSPHYGAYVETIPILKINY